MNDTKRHLSFAFAWAGVVALVVASCGAQSTSTAAPSAAPTTAPEFPAAATPVTVQQAAAAEMAAPSSGPNLLAENWSERLGIIVSELTPATGTPVLNPKPGDVWFFSNSSTAWGATNTLNAVWVIDAKTKQTVAEVAPFDGAGNSSHGIAVSGDAKFVYLPMLGQDSHIDVLDGRTLEVVQTIKTLGRPHHHKLWHDPNTDKDYIIGEDFNWNFTGSGFYVIDPSQNNAIVGGLSRGDFAGNPYVSTAAPDGSFFVVTVPAPMPAFRDKMDGWVAKINPAGWKIIGLVPMIDPLYPVVSVDGKYVYVTSGGQARVYKINAETWEIEDEVQTGPGPWGAALSYDQTRLYTADKGEGPGYNQQGHTSTIIDLQTMGVMDVVNIGLTTDHAILSPDGKEVWFTSNADHGIYVLDTATHETVFVQDPADGDIHGGVFVQYKDDGQGGVMGEVVADYAGLHNSALGAQRQYLSEPSLAIAFGRNGFFQNELKVQAGESIRLTLKNVGGTSTGMVTFESDDMGIQAINLAPGESREIRWTAPTAPGDLTATVNKKPNDTLTLVVEQPVAQPAAAATLAGAQVVEINSDEFAFNLKEVTVQAGQPVQFVFTNGDDEKHNLVGVGEGLNLLSPDVDAGRTVTYDWTAPSTPGTYMVLCAYHPQMTFSLVVK